MKTHTKKKLTRKIWKEMAQKGRIPDASGTWVARPVGGNSMHRDFSPQGK